MKFKPLTHNKVRLLLILVLIFIILCLFAIYFYEKFSSGKIVIGNIKIDSKAALVLNSMHQTSTKNGIKEWTLDASSAKLLKNKNKVVMENVSIVFFMKNSKKIYLSSKHGTLDTKTHDMTFSGDVRVRYTGYTLKTEILHYSQKRHIIYSMKKVRIKDNDSVIDGDSLKIDLNRGSIILKGNIKGLFSENSDLLQKLL